SGWRGVGVAPAQVVLHAAGQGGVVGVVRAAQNEGPQGPELWLDGVGPGGICRCEAQFDVGVPGPGADGGCLVGRQVVQDDVEPVAARAGGADGLEGGQGVIAAL